MTVITRSTKKDIAREAWFRLLAVLVVILTPLFWPLGVLILWESPFWNRRDKVIGTLILPGDSYWPYSSAFKCAQAVGAMEMEIGISGSS